MSDGTRHRWVWPLARLVVVVGAIAAYGVNQGTFNLYKLVRGDAAGSADAEAKAGN